MTECVDRFSSPVNELEVRDFVASVKPRSTKRQEEWALKIWKDWCESRAKGQLSEQERHLPMVLDANFSLELIDEWVPKFIMELRQTYGGQYNPTSIKCIVAALFRLVKENCNYSGLSFFDRNSKICKVLDVKLKDLKAKGIGLEIKRADCTTVDDEVRLWNSGVLSLSESKGLLYATFFYNGKVLALRGRSEHKDLRIEQFGFKEDAEGKCYVEFCPTFRKNNQGTTKFSKIRKKAIKQYDTESANSYYKIIKTYLAALPDTSGQFYRRPLQSRGQPKFGQMVIGINQLGNMSKIIFDEAGIKDDRRITNHGLRATAATAMFEAGFSQRTVAIRTGHNSNAIEGYIRDSRSTHIAVSAALEPVSFLSDSNCQPISDEKDKEEEICKRKLEVDDEPEPELKSSSDETPIVLEFRRGSKHLKVTL